VRLVGAHRHPVAHVRPQVRQHRDEGGGGRLPVHVEVAPDEDALPAGDGGLDALGRRVHVREVARIGGGVEIGIEEGGSAVGVGVATADERLGEQWVPAHAGTEVGGNVDGLRLEPAPGCEGGLWLHAIA